MERPRFSAMLVQRRHELGLSIQQASKILKLREDVLVAFEEGDYAHLPQSGYAQGMLSSYARYLGLNAREVVDLFQEELYEFRNGMGSHELRRRTRDTMAGRGISGYDVVNEAGSRPKAYVEYRPLLPSGGGPAGDIEGFTTTTPVRTRSSVQLAGAGISPAPGTRAYPGSPSAWQADETARMARYEATRPYNSSSSRERTAPSTARRRAAGGRRRSGEATRGGGGELSYADRRAQTRPGSGRSYRRDDVSMRRVGAGDYTDDMRYDEKANPYAPASTLSGRRSSRNIASVERPNVRRRSPNASRGRTRERQGGLAGTLAWFFGDQRRLLFLVFAAAVVILTLILVFSVSSCVNGKTQPVQGGQSVQVNNAQSSSGSDSGASADVSSDSGSSGSGQSGTSSSSSSSASDSSSGTSSSSTSDSSASTAKQEPKETVVNVSVADGAYTWLEVTCDGKSEVATSVTGPWNASYTVYESITVQVGNPDQVTVTNNGERVEFPAKASGVGTLTIKGTPKADDSADADSEDASGSTTGTTGNSSTSGTTTSSKKTSTTGA